MKKWMSLSLVILVAIVCISFLVQKTSQKQTNIVFDDDVSFQEKSLILSIVNDKRKLPSHLEAYIDNEKVSKSYHEKLGKKIYAIALTEELSGEQKIALLQLAKAHLLKIQKNEKSL